MVTDNLKKWRLDVYGKAAGVILGAMALALGTYLWTVAREASAATLNLYYSVPQHERILYGPSPRPVLPDNYPGVYREVEALKARQVAPMPKDLEDDLRAFLKAQKRKGQ